MKVSRKGFLKSIIGIITASKVLPEVRSKEILPIKEELKIPEANILPLSGSYGTGQFRPRVITFTGYCDYISTG